MEFLDTELHEILVGQQLLKELQRRAVTCQNLEEFISFLASQGK